MCVILKRWWETKQKTLKKNEPKIMGENRSGKSTETFWWPNYEYSVAVNTTRIRGVIQSIRGIEHSSRDAESGCTNFNESTVFYWHFNRLYWGRQSIFFLSSLSSAHKSWHLFTTDSQSCFNITNEFYQSRNKHALTNTFTSNLHLLQFWCNFENMLINSVNFFCVCFEKQ